jgi:hypothetical protein
VHGAVSALLEFKAQLPGWVDSLVPAHGAKLTGWRQEAATASDGACAWTFVSCDDIGRVSTLWVVQLAVLLGDM